MLRFAAFRFVAGIVILAVLSGPACTAKKSPGPRKPRNPQSQEQSLPETGVSEQAPPLEQLKPPKANPSENPSQSTSRPPTPTSQENVVLFAEPASFDFEFKPEPQVAEVLAPANAPAAAGKHPRLFFDADELGALQAKAKSGSQKIAERLFAYGDKVANSRRSLPPVNMDQLPKANGAWRKEGDKLMGVAAAYALQTNPKKKGAYGTWAKEAMSRVANWKAWGPSAEYAVGLDGAHILFGFSVAYDLLHNELAATERKSFAERIHKQAELFYEETQARKPEFWTTSYTNNHNYINYNALLNAALAVEAIYPREAEAWIKQCVKNTDLVMEIRSQIGDGSTNEGIMYGTYGSHALFATLELLHEHRLADHLDNVWLTQHFNFLLHGSLPGFQRVVGIADGHGSFGHGPRHLLYFLDRVTRDGRPTWVANRIDEALGSRQPYGKPEGSNLLFEMLWHDPSIEPRTVNRGNAPGFHYFKDWGVVTYRRGWSVGNTFFSFKSGDPAGEATWGLMLDGDPRVAATNVSHSHPDAGSFTFYPEGQDFVAGALYPKPKRTALSNTYTFTPPFAMAPPIPESAISRLWNPKQVYQIGRLDEVGQLGEWGQWMGPIKPLVKAAPNADIVTAVNAGDAIFVSGEFGGAYPKQVKRRNGSQELLGIESVYRSMLLLPEDLLLIVDRVQTHSNMGTNAYFRALSSPDHKAEWKVNGNIATLSGGGSPGSEVELYAPLGVQIETGREIISYEDAKGDNRRSIKDWDAVSHSSVYARFSKPSQSGAETYVYLVRPNGTAGDIDGLKTSDTRGVTLNIETTSRIYDVWVATDQDAAARAGFLGFDGHVRVNYSEK
ncbi:MAG: hypothetical protein MK209_01565 [Planctomycetes bacterium]|nr:hypothetical protein [Planctomycetota bacterium]